MRLAIAVMAVILLLLGLGLLIAVVKGRLGWVEMHAGDVPDASGEVHPITVYRPTAAAYLIGGFAVFMIALSVYVLSRARALGEA